MSRSIIRLGIVLVTCLVLFGVSRPAAAAPEGTVTWGVHITLASRWLDPAETEGIITPFMFLYALHDAVVKPMPAGWNTPSLAESWSQSKDGLTYEFVLRKGVKFHNGDPVTAEDVKFSYDRYRGAGVKLLKDRVREVQVVDPGRIRFVLKEPWPDFMTFYGTSATGAGWVVPKKYIEKVGDDGFKKAPIGAGPYKFVSFNPSSSAACPRRRRGRPHSRTVRSTSPICLPARSPKIFDARPGSSSRRRASRAASSGSTCPINGIRNRRGTTAACVWRPATRSIARRSTRQRRSGFRSRPAVSSRAPSSSRSRSSRPPSIRLGPSS